MMRRGVGRTLRHTAPSLCLAVRWQGSGSSTGSTTTSSDGGLHTYIRDYAQGTRQARARDGPGSPAGAAAPEGETLVEDWATRLQRELLTEEDPMGGLAHKDYYRDPATGYSPQYAPRNFARGGEVAYSHAMSPLHYHGARQERDWLQHDVAAFAEQASHVRATARELTDSPTSATDTSTGRREGDVTGYLASLVPPGRFARYVSANPSSAVLDQLAQSTTTTDARLRQHVVLDRFQAVRPSAPASSTHETLPSDELSDWLTAQQRRLQDDMTDERLRIEHGLRAKERHDFAIFQRTTWRNFEGYDMDRFAAQQKGSPYGALQLPVLTPPGSMAEAQRNLRDAATPAAVQLVQDGYARNTVSATPQLGEGLTESIVHSLHAARQTHAQKEKAEREERFGLGRQGALVQDGGPDRRTLQRYKNDERLRDAMDFASNAYRLSPTDEHTNPYERRDTQRGVGHLLTNRFDMERREYRVGRGAQDLTERNVIHYGTPVQQTVDEFVLRRRNARGERPLDYFRPFPDFRALRLQRMYSDVEGFSLMRQRPEMLEWELFTRYRAHHQQRRQLALQHGLEPLRNETAQERHARRLALDRLCEATPFDPSFLTLHDDEVSVDVETLRSWFGVYLLPSPSVVHAMLGDDDDDGTVSNGGGAVNIHLQHLNDELGTADRREHVLSGRYLTRLLLFEAYQHRLSRGYVNDVAGRAPEPHVPYAQPADVLRHFSPAEQAMYAEYVKVTTEAQAAQWRAMRRGRRLITEGEGAGQYGEVVGQAAPVRVVDVRHAETGAVMTIATKKFEKELQQQQHEQQHDKQQQGAPSSTRTSGKDRAAGTVMIHGEPYEVLPGTERQVVPLSIQLESGQTVAMSSARFGQFALEEPASARYNHGLNYGVADYAYNRGNYVETQDVLWERATAAGTEGWSPATHADGLRAGLPVRARRPLSPPQHTTDTNTPTITSNTVNDSSSSSGGCDALALRLEGTLAPITGGHERACIVDYAPQPFFNPEPRHVTLRFAGDDAVLQVPLADVMIWQRQYYGPDRVHGDASRRFHGSGIRRYVDVADPDQAKARAAAVPHFLDKYATLATRRNPNDHGFRTVKQITEIDQWSKFDTRRPENYRPLGISHRKDYIRQSYYFRYTPWEWIALQEADQPLIAESLRSDDVGPSHFFALNRFWRYKARPHGYLRHFEHEVRDLFQYVDGVTPWGQAQKIRTYWEVRQHHPMPQFNRPEVAMHRNTANLLPTQLWETDKKTGKVRSVRDSVRDYKTRAPLPTWVQL